MSRFTEAEARAMCAHAILIGQIREDEPCAACNVPQGPHKCSVRKQKLVVRHHPDLLNHPLRTVPLCRPCHAKVHWGSIPDPATGERRATRRSGPSISAARAVGAGATS